MPEGAVYVGRPTKWGNPYFVVQDGLGIHVIERVDGEEAYLVEVESIQQGREIAVGEYSLHVGPMGSHELDMDEVHAELSGRDLVCWCSPDQPCHADVLLDIAAGGDGSCQHR